MIIVIDNIFFLYGIKTTTAAWNLLLSCLTQSLKSLEINVPFGKDEVEKKHHVR